MIEQSITITGWWFVMTVFAGWLCALAYPLFQRYVSPLPAGVRSLARLAYGFTAPLASLVAVLLVSQPGLAGWLLPSHCHGAHCGTHTPVYPANSAVILAAAAICSLAACCLLVTLARALRRGQRKLRALHAFARPAPDYRIIEHAGYIACCAGLWRPKVLVSRTLLECLRPAELQIVLAHEQCHAGRRDNLRALLLRWATALWPRGTARRIRDDAQLDAELVCDRAAADPPTDRAPVAALIRKLSRLSRGSAAPQASGRTAFDCGDIHRRLQALGEDGALPRQSPAGGLKVLAGVSAAGCLQIYLLTAVSHRGVEWIGGLLT